MRQLFTVFSHELTDEQKADARSCFCISRFFSLPDELQKIWSQLDPEGEVNNKELNKITEWLMSHSMPGDFVLIQGEFGATYYLVNFCLNSNLNPIYATTKRIYSEKKLEDGSVARKHIFKHIRFRKYKNYEG